MQQNCMLGQKGKVGRVALTSMDVLWHLLTAHVLLAAGSLARHALHPGLWHQMRLLYTTWANNMQIEHIYQGN